MAWSGFSATLVDRLAGGGKLSYSQCGEDLIIDFFFSSIRSNPRPSYLDLGAFHPVIFSNTYRFYQRGCEGVCVEPDPALVENFKRRRKRDVLLKVGVGAGRSENADFYVMSSKTLNTFSAEEARRCHEQTEHKIEKIIRVPLIPINEIIRQNFDRRPDFVSLDIEGYDLEVMSAFDFSEFRPELFCVETLEFATGQKSEQMTDFMNRHGYSLYADTYVNTIFVDGALMPTRTGKES